MISSIIDSFSSGGLWMWVILALQLISIAIIIERVVALYVKRKPTELAFANEFETDIRKGKLSSVLERVKETRSEHPLSTAIQAGVQAAQGFGGKDEIQGKMDEVLLSENSSIEQRTAFLAMLANVGTLTGLLGTIVGMIKSFTAVSSASPVEKATLLSQGISEAMNTTAYGLMMAIPALIMFAVLNNRATQLSEDLNQGALKVFNWLSFAYESVPVKMARTADVQAAKKETANQLEV